MAAKIFFVAAMLFCANVLVSAEEFPSLEILRRIDALEQQIGELKERDRNQQAEIETLRKQNVDLESEVNQLRGRDEQQTNRIKVLEDQGRVMVEALMRLMIEGKGSQGRFTDQQANDDNVRQDNETNTARDTKEASVSRAHLSTSHNRIRQVGSGNAVAFFATLTTNSEHLGHNQPIVFDHDFTNIGHGYHTSTGVFTAPVAGAYVFSATIFGSSTSAHFEYAVNGKYMCRMYVHGTEVFETTSQTVIFNLNQGDDVVLRNADADKRVIGSEYSTFSGFRLPFDADEAATQIVG